ncbi:PREDICTED: uncharacterized protein LOC108518644 [Rhinopithecus bieti]|uniref:uncharacterized protein LOC108518644 n=1 Tax=Rhinopithecus bieti TaxID=61621 RepID=UPI00083BEED0|nr:PREDICTED: uncharacterized protein LOC108518644 [Rhinopithecus bieti]
MASEALNLSMDPADVVDHLRVLHLPAMQVIPVLPSQHLQLLILDLVQPLSLAWPQWAMSSYWVLTSTMMLSTSKERLLSMDSTTDVSEIWDCSSWISSSHSSLISQPFQSSSSPCVLPSSASSFSFSWPGVQLLPKVVDMALEHAVRVAPSCLLLLLEAPLSLQHLFCCSRNRTLLMKEANLLRVLICSFSWVCTARMLGSRSSLRELSRLWFTMMAVSPTPTPYHCPTIASTQTHAGA